MLSSDWADEDAEMYDVIGYSKGRDNSVKYYEDLFEYCPDPIRVDVNEMMGMLEDSLVYLQ